MSVHCYNGVKEPHDKQPKIWTLQYLLLHWAQHVFQVKEVSDSQVATRPNYIFWNTKKTQASKQPAILKSLIRSNSLSLTQNNQHIYFFNDDVYDYLAATTLNQREYVKFIHSYSTVKSKQYLNVQLSFLSQKGPSIRFAFGVQNSPIFYCF
ncbi:Hypothetical_protein [Hexamita inflata]|uniref:Hypothetical_protein n=1 Tax=Hexamita inflata TaxID=28002 RepID=A0AA86Q3J4_9EUKA|nr:Hypothetical protein HINF_LOCUS38233 [Hexamita inflata]CAI9959556.1 Hypothetical protein HINF_LOCUS47201 [Hexamita inflata]